MVHKIRKYFELIVGMFIIALAFNLFINPLKVAVGGTNGLAIIINEVFGINTTLFIKIFYFASLLLNLIVFGVDETKKVLLGSIVYPLLVGLLDNVTSYIVLDYSNKLLMYLVSAVLLGVGNGLVYKNGYLTGGTDVIKKIINEKMKIPMGTAVFIFDGVVVLLGGIIFGLESVLYAIIILYISSKITDRVILGISKEKMFYIMTQKPDEVRSCIIKELASGVTELDAVGGYTDNKNHILMCVIPTKNYLKLERKVTEIDKDAFFLITDSYHMYHGKVKYGVN